MHRRLARSRSQSSALVAACFAVTSACTPAAVAVPSAWLDVGDDEIVLDGAAPDTDTLFTILVHNVGTARAHADLEVSGPFTLAAPALALDPGASGPVSLILTPLGDYQPVEGRLVLATVEQRFELALSATFDADRDQDGHLAEPAGGDDCDDDDALSFPGAYESCDDRDNDCDGTVDDPAEPPAWFPDEDDDAFGDAWTEPELACDPPAANWVRNGDDCDDDDPDTHPDADEVWYDGHDQDCDGGSDFDRDGDGYDNVGTGGHDCNDANAAVNPGAAEVDDGVDNDCDDVTA